MIGHVHFVQSVEQLEGGGLGAAAAQLHAALRLDGIRSRLLTTRSAYYNDERSVEQFVRKGPTKAFFAPGLYARAATLVGEAGTIIHGHGFYVYPNAALGRIARAKQVPLVYHVHGMFEPWILSRSKWKKTTAHLLFENANFRHAKLWRALTGREADQIRGQGITAPVVVLPNGIDLAEFDSVPPSGGSEKHTLLFLGRLHPKKGLDVLLKAWAALGPVRKDWILKIVGPDEGGYQATVAGLIESTGLETSVELCPGVSGIQKAKTIHAADAFVLTSYSEGLPMAVLEAMACKKPIVLTEECNLPEVAAVGAGWSCRPTEDSVRSALIALMSASDAERNDRGAAGRTLVEKKFQWRAVAQELHAAAEQLL